MLKVRLNDTALAMVYGWCGLRKCDYGFYNLEPEDVGKTSYSA